MPAERAWNVLYECQTFWIIHFADRIVQPIIRFKLNSDFSGNIMQYFCEMYNYL